MCYCSYVDGEECPEELVIHFTVAQWSSNTVRDTVARFGARIIEVSRHSARTVSTRLHVTISTVWRKLAMTIWLLQCHEVSAEYFPPLASYFSPAAATWPPGTHWHLNDVLIYDYRSVYLFLSILNLKVHFYARVFMCFQESKSRIYIIWGQHATRKIIMSPKINRLKRKFVSFQ